MGSLKKIALRYWDVTACTYEELLAEMDVWRQDGGRHFACFCDANVLAHGWLNPRLAAAYRAADAVFADGGVTKRLGRICGGVLPTRVTGPQLFPQALAYGLARGWRHFFYGAGPGVAEELADAMRARFPGVEIVGTYTPPFGEPSAEEWARQKAAIASAKPDFLWVALGSPKQEMWCARHIRDLAVPVLLPVGAVFDFYTGRVPQVPEWVHRAGICWLWRMLTGGRRTLRRNIWCVPRAAAILLREFVRVRLLRRPVRALGA
ncbi:MAG TPA: glycosyltransferase [Verrucomicrobia bacterium]|nr:glycosyltransferase [Verrucomicrobiota bacterium]HCG20567.1 glycosyltransferase [Verrucomicrobiota bacterium]